MLKRAMKKLAKNDFTVNVPLVQQETKFVTRVEVLTYSVIHKHIACFNDRLYEYYRRCKAAFSTNKQNNNSNVYI